MIRVETDDAAELLREIRRLLGLTQTGLAETINRWAASEGDGRTTTPSSLSRAEKDGAHLDTLRRVASALSLRYGTVARLVLRFEMPTPEEHSMNLPTPQFVSALELATAYGHQWAQAYKDAWNPNRDCGPELVDAAATLRKASLGDSVPLSVIRAVAEAWPHADAQGLYVPKLEGERVVHRTATGRLSWEIEPSGEICLAVRRPSDDGEGRVVLAAHVKGYELTCSAPDGAKYAKRHVEALKEALAAVRSPHWDWSSLEALWVGCQEVEPEAPSRERHEERVRATLAAAMKAVGADDEPSQRDCADAALLLRLDLLPQGEDLRTPCFRGLGSGRWSAPDGEDQRSASREACDLLRADAGEWVEWSEPSPFVLCELVANSALGESAVVVYRWLLGRAQAAEGGPERQSAARVARYALSAAVSHDDELARAEVTERTRIRVEWLDANLPGWRASAGAHLDYSGAALAKLGSSA